MSGNDERIIRQGAATALWQALVRDGERRCGKALGDDVEAYLVFALMRHLRDERLAARVLALEWLAAHERRGSERLDALRDVGDRCLIIAGLFPAQAERRRVDASYFIDLGRSAYDAAAASARQDLFAQLVAAYQAMVEVLAAMAGRSLPAARGGTIASHVLPADLRPRGVH